MIKLKLDKLVVALGCEGKSIHYVVQIEMNKIE